ncbi:MAG: cation:dicarboxylase symporter family transporter, partial [Pseudomonadota bacterium]
MQLWMKTLIGMVLGLLFGFYIPDYAIQLKFLGDVFLKLIKMVIPFIVFFAVMKGIIGQNTDDLKGIGLKAVIYYIITTIFAVLIGMVMAFIMKPGQGIDILQITGTSSSFDLSASVDRLLISDFILSVIPVNIFQSFIELNILQILFFAIILSLTINSIGLSSAFKTSVENGLNIFITMILYIMELAPYAIFVFFSVLVSTLGLEI